MAVSGRYGSQMIGLKTDYVFISVYFLANLSTAIANGSDAIRATSRCVLYVLNFLRAALFLSNNE